MSLNLLSLGLKLLKLLCIITIRVLVPRMQHKLIHAGIRNQMISFSVVDLSIMGCISLQLTVVIIWINIIDDPLH